VVPIFIGRPEKRRDSEEAARRDPSLDAVAREIPAVAEPDKGTVVARQAVKPSRLRRWRPRALPKKEKLFVGLAEYE